ncbi:MAG: YcxB family protein [Clostridiales bacterium]|nr:YcxB family protein [Clostridiales bacterium]
MEIKYQLTKDDYIDFNLYHMEHSASFKRSIFIQRYIVSLIFLIMPFALKSSTDIPFWYWLTICSIVYLVWVIFYNRYMRWNTARRLSKMVDEGKNKDMLGERSLKVFEEGIMQTNELNESKVAWKSIERIAESKSHIFIYTSAVSSYIVPLRAFDDKEQKEEFLRILKTHVQA